MYEAIDVRLLYFPFFFSFDLDSIFLTLDSAPCSLSLSRFLSPKRRTQAPGRCRLPETAALFPP